MEHNAIEKYQAEAFSLSEVHVEEAYSLLNGCVTYLCQITDPSSSEAAVQKTALRTAIDILMDLDRARKQMYKQLRADVKNSRDRERRSQQKIAKLQAQLAQAEQTIAQIQQAIAQIQQALQETHDD